MPGQTLTTIAGALKRDYHGPIIDSLNNLSVIMSLLEKNEEDVSGEDLSAYIPLKLRRNQAAGNRAENEALPVAQYVKTVQVKIPLKYIYGSIKLTGQTIKALEKSVNSFTNKMDLEIKGMVDTIRIDCNRQFYGDGTGILCLTNGAGNGSTSTVTVDTPGTANLEEGMPIVTMADYGSTAAAENEDISHGLTASTAHIVGKKLTSTTFQLNDYLDAEITTEQWHTDHYMFRWGNRNNEMVGLQGIVDNEAIKATSSWRQDGAALTTIYGKSRADYPILDSNIVHNSNVNTPITEDRIQQLLDTIEQNSGKKSENKSMIMITTYGVRRKYVEMLQADRRYDASAELSYIGGWKAIGYQAGNDKIPIFVDRHCTANTLYALDRRFISIYRAGDFDWMPGTDDMFSQSWDSSGKYDAWEATMFGYLNLGCPSPKNQGALRDITE